jgi:hypothetical protein
MRSSFFVTASVLSSMFIGTALVSAVLTHAAHVHDGSIVVPTRLVQH